MEYSSNNANDSLPTSQGCCGITCCLPHPRASSIHRSLHPSGHPSNICGARALSAEPMLGTRKDDQERPAKMMCGKLLSKFLKIVFEISFPGKEFKPTSSFNKHLLSLCIGHCTSHQGYRGRGGAYNRRQGGTETISSFYVPSQHVPW